MQITGAVLERCGALRAPEPITIGPLELAPPGHGELLVRIEAAGLRHSDLSIVDGSRVRPVPMPLGHETAGIVEETGPGTGTARGPTPLPWGCTAAPGFGELPCEMVRRTPGVR